MFGLHSMYEAATFIFDPIHHFWGKQSTKRVVSKLLVFLFLGGLLCIELNIRGVLPDVLAKPTPTSYFKAISLAFTMVLFMEVLSLIFILPCSFSKSMGKQLEVMAMILLRNAFKDLSMQEGVDLAVNMEPLLYIFSDGVGALLIFVALGIYYNVQGERSTMSNAVDIYRFVSLKKLLSLILLVTFLGMAVYGVAQHVMGGEPYKFLEKFYTMLIFTDILIVLISQQYIPSFHAIFRNSGYVIATLLMRLSLTAPKYYDAAIAIAAAVFAICLTVAFNKFAPDFEDL